MEFPTRLMWEAGQSAEYMQRLDDGVRDVTIRPLNPVRTRRRAPDGEGQGQGDRGRRQVIDGGRNKCGRRQRRRTKANA
jgi:hypothetical protein